jgi:hypothetical protein
VTFFRLARLKGPATTPFPYQQSFERNSHVPAGLARKFAVRLVAACLRQKTGAENRAKNPARMKSHLVSSAVIA